jgi:hypothetical protein
MSCVHETTYRPTQSKYKGGAHVMFITYDLEQSNRAGRRVTRPRAKRVYIAGEVKGWQEGDFRKRTGRTIHGVRVEYEQSRKSNPRRAHTAARDEQSGSAPETEARAAWERFAELVELPVRARNVRFYTSRRDLPEVYRQAVQRVR